MSVLTYTALHTGQLYYLADLVEPHKPSGALQSANFHLLAVPSCPRSSFASQAFCVFFCLITGIFFLSMSAHLTVLLLKST